MPSVAAPADKRFRRAHVKPSRKRIFVFRHVSIVARVGAVLALMVYGGWRATTLILGAPALRIARVTVHGNERLSSGEVLALVAGLRERNILTVRLDEWRERLLLSRWVEDATLRRRLPSSVDVHIRERRPIGIGRVANVLYLVDARGVIIDQFGPNYADLDLPIIDGLAVASASADGVPALDASRALLAARLLHALETRPDLAARVSQIDVSDAHDAVVLLEADTVMLRLGEDQFIERLQVYLDLGPTLRERVAGIDYVDLRFDDRLYVRPAARKKSTAESPAPAGSKE